MISSKTYISVVLEPSGHAPPVLKVSFSPWRNWCYTKGPFVYCFCICGRIKRMTSALSEQERSLYNLGTRRNEPSLWDVLRDDHLGEAWAEPPRSRRARETEIMGYAADNRLDRWFFFLVFLGQHRRWVSTQTEWRKQREQEWMRVISHMSVLAPGCPQSNLHHYAFMPDLCDVGDVAVSFLFCFTRQETEGWHPL